MRSVALAASLTIVVLAGVVSDAGAQSVTTMSFRSADSTAIIGYLLKPEKAGRRPAVIALHGCSGLLSRSTGQLSARHAAWGRTLVANGYVVLFPDSFGSRGFGSLCRHKPRLVKHHHRQKDVSGARRWLAAQKYVAPGRISVLGWSNGGSTALRVAASNEGRKLHRVIAFYPGCRTMLKKMKRRPTVPLKIIMGAADDWTPPEPCIALAREWDIKVVLYKGAYHSFDTPNSKVRVRRGMAYSKRGDGVVHVGTHEEARRKAIREVLRSLN